MITNLNYGNFNYNKNWFDTLMFIDFDGTVIRTYTNDMIQSLTELPPIPNHTTDDIPLTSQGWNWTLSEIKSYNRTYPDTVITVGPIYCTTDGKTHFICKPGAVEAWVLRGTGEVDWGDGTIETVTDGRISHYYSGQSPVHYTIRAISWDSGYSGIGIEPRSDTYHIRCGQNVSLISTQGPLHAADSLEDISLSSSVHHLTITPSSDIRNSKLKAVVLPKANGYSVATAIVRCQNFKVIASSYAGTTTTSDYNSFHVEGCPLLCRFTVPDGAIRAWIYTYSDSPIRNKFAIAGSVETIHYVRAFNDLIIGNKVKTIESISMYPASTHILHMRRTTPPSGSPGYGAPRLIYVPYSSNHSVLNAYKTAEGWSDYADIIQEEPQ